MATLFDKTWSDTFRKEIGTMLNPPLTAAGAATSMEFQALKKFLRLGHEDVVDIAVKTQPRTTEAQCYENCIMYSTAEWRPLCGWMVFLGLEDNVVTTEHHCVLLNVKSGDYWEVSPHPGSDFITFLPDRSFSYDAIKKIANTNHMQQLGQYVTVAGYIAETADLFGYGRCVDIHQNDPDDPRQSYLYRDALSATEDRIVAAKKARNKKRKKKRKAKKCALANQQL